MCYVFVYVWMYMQRGFNSVYLYINTESMQREDQPIDEEMILAFQAEITAHQHFLFQQEKHSEGGS